MGGVGGGGGACRLILVIDELISHEQSTIIKGRQILDGPLILNEIISLLKSRKDKALLFKVNYQKEFDSVRWDHLDDIIGWSKLLPIKFNVFTCRMFFDKLPTRINLSKRGLDVPCVLCLNYENEVESRNHHSFLRLFDGFGFVLVAWSIVGMKWNL
ncbi:RNA-directed DNA polymerase, eukaryota, reverse transcriptase zinc-binding domain protein, partial [Tanacetum coccineum]